jgi:hypothetical protein
MSKRNFLNLKEFAQRLLAHETVSRKPVGADKAAAFRVCEKLRVSLGRFMGVAGYRSLLSRALAIAGAKVQWLRGLHVQADGTLEGLAELESKLNEEQIAQGEVALVVELLELMVSFIGPALTSQLIHDVWPRTDLSEFEY